MEAQVPFLDLTTQHEELEEELIVATRSVVRSGRFVGGPEVELFEQEFADYCGTKFCVGVGSGTDALRFALIAAGVGPGDAVLTVANTFIATVEAISQAGAVTEFVDIDERTYCMSASSLSNYLDRCEIDPTTGRPLGLKTRKPVRAIVPVHLYGQVADMEPLLALADKHRLTIIEDACQAHGAEYCGELLRGRAGSFGRAAAFSFYPGKNLGACGEAGAITTNDGDLAGRVRMIRDHGQAQKYYHALEGYNGRLDALQAAFLRIKLRYLDTWTDQRRQAARRYHDFLAGRAADDVVVPYESPRSRAVYHLYVVQTPDRDLYVRALSAAGIQTGLHYPLPLHRQACYRDWGYGSGSLPMTERVSARIISLPMFPNLTLEQQQRVAAAINEVARPETV